MKKILLAIAIILSLAGQSPGQWDIGGLSTLPPASQFGSTTSPSSQLGTTSRDISMWRAACIVSQPAPGSGTFRGSGVLIRSDDASDMIVATAWHVVRDGDRGRITVTFPVTGEVHKARLLYRGANRLDVAFLELATKPTVLPFMAALKYPQKGDSMTMVGFGGTPRNGFLAWGGVVLGTADTDVIISIGPSQGDSGGPVLDGDGRVVGVISATESMYSRRTTYAACWKPGVLAGIFRSRGCGPRTPQTPQSPRPAPPVVPGASPGLVPPLANPAVDYGKIVDKVIERLQKEKGLLPKDGVKGEKGDRGEKGDPGEVSEDQITQIAIAVQKNVTMQNEEILSRLVNLENKIPTEDALAARILAQLPSIEVNSIRNGKVVDTVEIPLGGVLNIDHRPITN